MPISSMASGRMWESSSSSSSSRVRPRSGAAPIGDLANDDVLIEAVELAHARGQQLQQRAHREAAQQADGGGSLAGLAGAQNVAQIVEAGLSEFADEFDNAIAFDAFLGAEEAVGEVFDGTSGKLLQDVD